MAAVYLLVLLLSAGSVVGTFYPKQPFIDPACQAGDCSWKYSSASDPNVRVQSCSILDYKDNGAIDGVCVNPIDVPENVDERPGPAHDIVIEDFTKNFGVNVTGDPDTAGDYTCLRIKYKLREHFANKIKGMQFTLRGRNSADLSLYFCQNHDHGGSTDYYAVQDYVNQKYIAREFIYECFCGIKPGAAYDFIMRTLPVDYSVLGDPHDTAVIKNYPNDAVNPSSCEKKPGDKRCEWSPEGLWHTKCQNSQQVRSGNYETVRIEFDQAPEELKSFNRYKVLLYYFNKTSWKVGDYTTIGKILEVNKTPVGFNITQGSCMPESNFTVTLTLGLPKMSYKTFHNSCFVSVVQAFPTHKTCRLDGTRTACPVSISSPFCVIANPCSTADPDVDKCGENGSCHPYGEEYNCTCNETHMFKNGTCLIDECYSTPCNESTSVCQVYQNLNSPHNMNWDYKCSCKNGYLQRYNGRIPDLKFCIVNPCFSNPCNHGSDVISNTCKTHTSNGGYGYTCKCNEDEGYTLTQDKTTCVVDPCFSKPCGSGKCMKLADPDNMKSMEWTYSCECDEGFINVITTCKANPCILNSTNLTPCGPMGKCVFGTTSNGRDVSYNCTCNNGYYEGMNVDGIKTCNLNKISVEKILAGVLGSVVGVLILGLIAFCTQRKLHHRRQLEQEELFKISMDYWRRVLIHLSNQDLMGKQVETQKLLRHGVNSPCFYLVLGRS
ncbi:uncharacterized protein [Amphiura filiformis]|uniref:uncharacterized protein isoform X2 n=1 Tax=Amphiura filiformis TaxID=82378 RepID=UPI003B2152B1